MLYYIRQLTIQLQPKEVIMYYSGIDYHKRFSYITTINEEGIILKQGKVQNNKAAFLNYFRGFEDSHQAVIEATAGWYWVHDLLKSFGIELIVAHAKYLKAISYAKVKTDKVDSQTLAQLLRLDFIPKSHQISPQLRGMRDTMRCRLRLVQRHTSCLNSIYRLMEKFNVNDVDELDELYQFQYHTRHSCRFPEQ